MSYHPAYPTTADLSREADAEERDVADLVALRDLRQIVADAIARAGRIDRIHHPDRRWSTEELLDVLQGELANIDGEAERIRRSPLVLEDA
jgi:hypothetical protein